MAAAVDMEELFGEMSDDEAPKQQAAAAEEGLEDVEDTQDERAEKKRRNERQRTGPPLHVELPVPAAKMGLAETMMMRLNNIVTVKHRPFDPDSHAVEGELVRDAGGNEQFKSLDLNVIRWRIGINELGEETVESNARLVRFSDGSVQLEIGDEILKVAEADMGADNDFLAVQHAGGLLECKQHLRRKITCFPSSINSKSHKLLSRHLDKRHVKVTKVKRTVTTIDPEFELEAKRKEIEKDQRSMMAMRRKQEKIEMRHAAQPRRRSPQRDRDDLDAEFLEGDDDDRRPAKKASAGGKKGGKKRERYANSDEDSAEDSDQSYSEEEEKPRPKKKMPPGARVIESDSD